MTLMSLIDLNDIQIEKEFFNKEKETLISKWITLMYATFNHKKIITKNYISIGDSFDVIKNHFKNEEYYLIDPYKLHVGKKIIHKGRVVLLDKANVFVFLKNRFKVDEWIDYVFMPLENNSSIIFCNEEGSFFLLNDNKKDNTKT